MKNCLLRRDFVPMDMRCATSDCSRSHRSGKAWVILADGQEQAFCPYCASTVLGGDIFREQRTIAPDLTIHELSAEDDTPWLRGGPYSNVRTEAGRDRRLSNALGYLQLRAHVLPSIPGIHASVRAWPALMDLFHTYQTQQRLTDQQVLAIVSMEEASVKKAWVLGRNNLMDVYAGYHLLQRQRRKLAKSIFNMQAKPWLNKEVGDQRIQQLRERSRLVENVIGHLLQKLYLTPKQMAALDLQMRADAFTRPGMLLSVPPNE